ncbi:nuclear import and export protein Msn5 [Hortaea werneckii]|nr:nuclear import and export protein Msn5 [Hortaea werneckii]
MDGAFDTYWAQPQPPTSDHLSSIRQALDATLDPRVPNDVRQQALGHLESLKHQPDAPHYGFALADDWQQNAGVRYFGLQLLEFAVRYKWTEYNPAHTEQIRTWIKCLAGSLRDDDRADPSFLRNKVAQVWVEVAKRSWGDEWMDMDAALVTLWEKPMSEKGVVNKLFVCYVLETLSEDVVNSEDPVAGLRLDVLGAALNEIMIPLGLYEEYRHTRPGNQKEVRCGEQGWLSRMAEFFALCVKQARMGGQHVELVEKMSSCAVKALNAMRPTMSWISLRAAVEANCVDCLFLPLHTEDVALQTAATETLHALLARPYNAHWHDSWLEIVVQAMRADRLALIKNAFEQSASQPGEDDAKYTLQKKMSEVLSVLSDNIAYHPTDLVTGNKLDLPLFFDLLLQVLQSKSLVVSIPVLHSWSKLLSCEEGSVIDLVFQALGPLVQTCSERLLRYENLPSSIAEEDTVCLFLDEDFDTIPERHAFLGNYRRYCTNIIQTIARSRPLDALQHVLSQMSDLLTTGTYSGGRGFNSENYSKSSFSVLRFDAQYTVVSAALKGYSAWCADASALSHEEPIFAKAEADRQQAEQALQEWSYGIMETHTDDPEVAAMVLQTLVSILRTLKSAGIERFVLHVVQHLLTMQLYDNPTHTAFSDSVKSFEGLRVVELQKLALTFSNELLQVYNELEPRIGVLAQKHSEDVRLVWGYKAFLFMIIHRASNIAPNERLARLQGMLAPVYEAWQDQSLSKSVVSLESFCEALALDNLADFFQQHGFHRVADWSAQQLDTSGQARQTAIKERNDSIPLRMTKSMLAATTEKLKPGSEEFETACALWAPLIPVILPPLMKMLRHAQAYHNMSNWSQLPDELQQVVKRSLQDRFWQSGISSESKEDFYKRISGSKTSLEGFASVVRGTMRNVREQGYHIIYLLTKFDERFYGALAEGGSGGNMEAGWAELLAQALFQDAKCLGANHLHPIINLTTGLVQRCPPQRRAQVLPFLIGGLFNGLDAKVSSEWEAIAEAQQGRAGREEDELGDEMRTESVLRQLTYSMVSFVPFLLEHERQQLASNGKNDNGVAPPLAKPTVSELVLSDPSILEPMMLFCTHALRMHDQRCCSTICKTFRTILPLFTHPSAPPAPQVREFISTEVLKAAITSLNEPYFADLQKDLASLIAQMLVLYTRLTGTPRDVLLSLPDMSVAKVDRALGRLVGERGEAKGSERQQRAVVLELLEGVRGVSIYEAGKIRKEAPKKKAGVQEKYMQVEQQPAGLGDGQGGEELEGVAGLFGDA